MRMKVAWVIVGVLIGMIVASVLPAGAHHATSVDRLKTRISRMESAVRLLNAKTQQLDPEFGDYVGLVIAEQVISVCPPGSSALWEANSIDPTLNVQWIDDCFTGEQQRAPSKSDLLRVLNARN